MGRSRASAKAAGTRFESAVVAYLRRVTGSDFIERRAKTGANDKGDVAGLRTLAGAAVCVEAKDHSKLDLAGWVRQAEVERLNSGSLVGVVFAKRRGAGSPGSCYVVMSGDDFATLLTGARPEPYVPGGAA